MRVHELPCHMCASVCLVLLLRIMVCVYVRTYLYIRYIRKWGCWCSGVPFFIRHNFSPSWPQRDSSPAAGLALLFDVVMFMLLLLSSSESGVQCCANASTTLRHPNRIPPVRFGSVQSPPGVSLAYAWCLIPISTPFSDSYSIRARSTCAYLNGRSGSIRKAPGLTH